MNSSLLNLEKIDFCNNWLCVHCNVFWNQIQFYNRDMGKFFVSNPRILRYQKVFDFSFVPERWLILDKITFFFTAAKTKLDS